MKQKIEVGMSTDEVKAQIGRPKAIEGGFPKGDEGVVVELPDQAGQLNNSTWFYFYKAKHINVDQPMTYRLSGYPVSEEMYNYYKDSSFVYTRKNKVVTPSQASSYLKLKDRHLRRLPIDPDYTYREEAKQVLRSFQPIFCVIFDKGTQVVAATKMYFQYVTLD